MVPGNVGRHDYPFKLVVPPLVRQGGTISGMEYLVLQQFAVVPGVQDPDRYDVASTSDYMLCLLSFKCASMAIC
jgi:hypothetical protein